MGDWQSLNDMRPPIGMLVLVYAVGPSGPSMRVAYLSDAGRWCVPLTETGTVTHWRALPTPNDDRGQAWAAFIAATGLLRKALAEGYSVTTHMKFRVHPHDIADVALLQDMPGVPQFEVSAERGTVGLVELWHGTCFISSAKVVPDGNAWISVSDALPPHNDGVLVWLDGDGGGVVCLAYRVQPDRLDIEKPNLPGDWRALWVAPNFHPEAPESMGSRVVTHWCRVPSAPQVAKPAPVRPLTPEEIVAWRRDFERRIEAAEPLGGRCLILNSEAARIWATIDLLLGRLQSYYAVGDIYP